MQVDRSCSLGRQSDGVNEELSGRGHDRPIVRFMLAVLRRLGVGHGPRAAAGLLAVLTLTSCAVQPSSIVSGDGTPEPTASAAPAPASPTPGTPSAQPASPKAHRATGYAGERVAVHMPVADCDGIIGEMDNVTSVELEGGDDLSQAARAAALFDLVGKQVADEPRQGNAVTVTLSRAQWAFVVDRLRESIPVYRRIDMPDEAASARSTIDLVQRQLAAATTAVVPAPGPIGPTHWTGRADEHQFYLMPFNADAVERLPEPSDRLVEVTPTDAIVLYTGRTYADVDLTVRSLAGPPAALADDIGAWEVGEEVTVRITEPLYGFSPFTDWYAPDVFVPTGPGLYRMRVLARGRVHDEPEDYEEISDQRATEHVEVLFWPVQTRQPGIRAGSDQVS